MKYAEELVKQWAEEVSNIAKQSTTCSYVIPYGRVDSFDPTDKECQKDVLECLWDFHNLDDNLQAIDFDDKNQHIVVMWYEPPTKENIEEDKEMKYQEQVKKAVQEFYDVTKAYATSRHYTLSYWWVESNFGLDLSNKQVRDDVWEMSYSDEFCDLIQTVDFDDDKKEVTIMIWGKGNGGSKMKKFTLKEWEAFCKEALICPPFEDEDSWQEWIDEHKIQIIANNCVMELDYDADAINEIEFSLREIHEAIYGDGTATTGNTIGSEYRNATWKDILRFAVLDGWYEDSHTLEAEVDKCIHRFTRDRFEEIIKKIDEQTSYNDELEVNFFKLETKDLWKIFDKEERRQAFKEILCSKVEISELIDKDGKHDDKTVIMDYSIIPSGDLVGWHYGVDFDKDSMDNQDLMQNYVDSMTR